MENLLNRINEIQLEINSFLSVFNHTNNSYVLSPELQEVWVEIKKLGVERDSLEIQLRNLKRF